MQFLFETISVVVLSLAAFLLFCLFALNLYLIKRNGFYVNVNCWFCNAWTKVLYNDRNSFDCPSCSQYNGFREDGSYNKIIEAQHNISLTKFTSQKTEYYENGLCTYCNNNQQLKIYQLARFTPINDNNYDVEVEHFRKQLEKVYKLCKNCEQVLKSTLNTQHSWIFGNRLRDLRKKGFSLLNHKKMFKQEANSSNFLRFIRYTLIFCTIFILCNILNIRVVYPHINLNKHIPKVFNPYKTLLIDGYQTLFDLYKRLGHETGHLNINLQKHIRINTSGITLVTFSGFVMDLILVFGEKRPLIWKINGIFSWIILVVTTLLSFNKISAEYVSGLQICVSSVLLYNYIWYVPIQQSTRNTKEYHFKKIAKPADTVESSEEDTDEEIPHPLNVSSKRNRSPRSGCAYSPPNQSLNSSFNTAKSVKSTSGLYNLNNSNDLNRSLDNLHLGFSSQRCTSPIYSVNSTKRPVLSPAKLKNITQNPWTAGGFWKNDVQVLSAAVSPTNLSRSSSQSSGFVSNHTHEHNPFNSLPVSREPSLNGDVDRVSILSEPAYHFSPINPSVSSFSVPKSPQLYYKADNNTFYPVLSQNNMLFIQNGIPHQSFVNSSVKSCDATVNYQSSIKNFDNKGFSNASLRSFQNNRVGGATSTSLFSEKTTTGLFKNINMGESFRKPQC